MEQLLALQTLQFDLPPRTDEGRAKMEKIREQIPSPVLAHYERLVLRGKKGVAIARNGACSECHLRIPSGTLASLIADNEAQLCDNCGRYLYLQENESPELNWLKPAASPSPSSRRSRSSQRHVH